VGNGHLFLSSLPSFQSFHIVILGLDCAEKTSVLYRLQFNEFVNTVPTKGFNSEKIKMNKWSPSYSGLFSLTHKSFGTTVLGSQVRTIN
uniref:Uncharacterized protein n=1 Tax=Propithecus coquereli TaxID=379532 RepID=A0A2K6ELE3_PROCO